MHGSGSLEAGLPAGQHCTQATARSVNTHNTVAAQQHGSSHAAQHAGTRGNPQCGDQAWPAEAGEAGGDSAAAFLGEAAGVVLLLRQASSTLRAGAGAGGRG